MLDCAADEMCLRRVSLVGGQEEQDWDWKSSIIWRGWLRRGKGVVVVVLGVLVVVVVGSEVDGERRKRREKGLVRWEGLDVLARRVVVAVWEEVGIIVVGLVGVVRVLVSWVQCVLMSGSHWRGRATELCIQAFASEKPYLS